LEDFYTILNNYWNNSFFPYLLTKKSSIGIDFTNTGQIGDTIGGIMGPFIEIAAAILTFFAFWVQYQANEQQKNDLEIERFENRFYNLIEIHRNNGNEIHIDDALSGRKAFSSFIDELKFIFYTVENYYNSQHIQIFPGNEIPPEFRYNVAYLIFFFGVGQNSSREVNDIIGNQYNGFFQNVERIIEETQALWQAERNEGRFIAVDTAHGPFNLNLAYRPGGGHMAKLSHYIRNLFQIVKFIHDQDDKMFPAATKYQYASTLRAQISAHEQLMLYYNALSVLGKPWIDNRYISEYCLIKSIPIPLANFYLEPVAYFGETNEAGRPMFEWKDVKDRMTAIAV
jgi:hypothetical protein